MYHLNKRFQQQLANYTILEVPYCHSKARNGNCLNNAVFKQKLIKASEVGRGAALPERALSAEAV